MKIAPHVLALVVLAPTISLQSPGGGIVARPPLPTYPNQTLIEPAAFQAQKLLARIQISTTDKNVKLQWAYNDAAGQRQFNTEIIDVSYWPTAASRISDDRLSEGGNFLVAGKRPSNGFTVIERWELSLSALPAPGTSTPITRTVIYDANAVGKRVVHTMNPSNSMQGQVFVHFDDSKDLYRINSTNGQLVQLLASSQVTALGNDSFQIWWGGKLASGAYVYVYQCDFAVYDDGALVFYDLDGNSTVDNWQYYSEAQWSSVESIAGSFVEKYDS